MPAGPECKVCIHPQRKIIDRELAERRIILRELSSRWGITMSGLHRHRTYHLPKAMARIIVNRELESVDSILKMIEQLMGPAKLLLEACDQYLRDPANPTRYTLEPRAEDIEVIYLEESFQGDPSGKEQGFQVRQKARLSQLLDKTGKLVLGTEWKVADPRDLVLKASLALDRQLRTLAQVAGYINEGPVTNIQVNVLAEIPTVMKILEQHPKVKAQVIKALEDQRRREQGLSAAGRTIRTAERGVAKEGGKR